MSYLDNSVRKLAEPEVKVLVARDRMSAAVQVSVPENCRPFTVDEVIDKIVKMGIKNVDYDAVEKACDYPDTLVTCAEGIPATRGSDASIRLLVEENKGQPLEFEDGRVDLKELNMYTIVHAGQVLAEKTPAGIGSAGTDVLGLDIPPIPGKDVCFPIGSKGIFVEENKAVAAINGRYYVKLDKMHIDPALIVPGDIDYSTGNINFAGDVIIRGSVQPGFSVKSEGVVEVFGAVTGGDITAKRAVIYKGIIGRSKSTINTTEDLVTDFIEHATIDSRGNVIVKSVILHSQVVAEKSIKVQGKDGLIVGGSVCAGAEICTQYAGKAAMGADLQAGVRPELQEEHKKLRKLTGEIARGLDEIAQPLKILRDIDPLTLSEERRKYREEIISKEAELLKQSEAVYDRMNEIQTFLANSAKRGAIHISKTILPGVKVTIGTNSMTTTDNMSGVTFRADKKDIKIEFD